MLLPQVDLANRCVIRNILPTGDKVIDDGFLSSGLPNYKEFWQTMTGLSGESQNFDGNGSYTRFQTGGSNQTVSTGPTTLGGPPLFGNAAEAPIGTRPARPGLEAAVQPHGAVLQERPAEPHGEDRGRAVKRAIRKHLRDFVALMRPVPGRARACPRSSCRTSGSTCRRGCPASATDFYKVKAEFSTAQAVVPGQGQTVDIAGVQVGDIGKVELKNGVAVVSMKIRNKYAPIYRDAHMLLRPKTGPEGHDRRDGSRHEGGRRPARGRHDPGRRTPRRT